MSQNWEHVSTQWETTVERLKIEGGHIYKTIQKYRTYVSGSGPQDYITMSTVFVPASLMEQVLEHKLKPNP